MKIKKIIKVVLAVVSIVALLGVGAVFAYFTAGEAVENIVVIGKVSTELQEPSWNEDDAKNITPNTEIAKDPKLVNMGINSQLDFMVVKIPLVVTQVHNDAGDLVSEKEVELFTFNINDGWTQLSKSKPADAAEMVYVFAYGTSSELTPLDAGEETPALFDYIRMANAVNVSSGVQNTTQKITVYGYAIQSDYIIDDSGAYTYAPITVFNVICNQRKLPYAIT